MATPSSSPAQTARRTSRQRSPEIVVTPLGRAARCQRLRRRSRASRTFLIAAVKTYAQKHPEAHFCHHSRENVRLWTVRALRWDYASFTWNVVANSAVESPPTQTSKVDASSTQSRAAAFQ